MKRALVRGPFFQQGLTTMCRNKSSRNEFGRSLLAAAAAGLLACGCGKSQAAAPPPPPVPVLVAKVSQQLMPVEVSTVGNVEAISTVSIRPQVSGQLLEIHFKEGDFVRKGQLLLTLDSRPFQAQVQQAKGAIVKDQAQLDQAEANLAKDSAQEKYAREQSERYGALWDKGLIPRETLGQMKSLADAAQQSLRADKAAIDSARASIVLDEGALASANMQLSYCTIYSPIDGRTGAVLQKPGNLLKASDEPVVVVNQVDPINVNFTVPQQYWVDIKKHAADQTLQVSATVPQDPGKPQLGLVTFVDSGVDPATGTIHLRATFENSARRLWPGLFVNAVLRLSEQPNATVIPAQAITQGQDGAFVFVVRVGSTAEMRPIVSSRIAGGLAVIEKGLNRDETVVIDGQPRLVNGTKVQIKAGQLPAAEEANEHP